LLDGSGQVQLEVGEIRDTLEELLGSYLTAEFGDNFRLGEDDDFPLIAVSKGLLKMKQMSQGVAPVFQTSFAGQRLYSELMARGGRSAEWATWMWSGGGKRQAPPKSLFTPPSFVTDKASKVHMPTGGWADPLA